MASPDLPTFHRPLPMLWQAPLILPAVCLTAGFLADRRFVVPFGFSVIAGIVSLLAWAIVQLSGRPRLALVYLLAAVTAGGAAYHHHQCRRFPADDIGNFATTSTKPVHLQGVLADEPIIYYQPPQPALRALPASDTTVATLETTQLRQPDGWIGVSGRVRLTVDGRLSGFHVGDVVEVTGRLMAPAEPGNPGEVNTADILIDHRMRAHVHVLKTTTGVTLVSTGWRGRPIGWLMDLRGKAQRELQNLLSPAEHGEPTPYSLPAARSDVSAVATALLVGEGSTMTRDDWEKYIRTGVIHVLAISGQHLMIMAGFLWFVLRVAGCPRRKSAIGIALILIAYAILTGNRPPAMRAAVTVAVLCGSFLTMSTFLPANALALAWIAVALWQPADLFTAGCQLSFLAVAILYLGGETILPLKSRSRLEELARQQRSPPVRWILGLGRHVLRFYLWNLVLWTALAPLVASHTHLVSPVALFIGPPAIWLTAVAMIAGFFTLAVAPISHSLAWLPAYVTRLCLSGTEFIVNQADSWSGSYFYVGDIPAWWLWSFYAALLLFLLLAPLRRHWRYMALTGAGWLVVGFVVVNYHRAPHDFRCTFLAVGHGGCTVLETPEGHVLLYDAGALGGPDVTRRQIAPFLWHIGIRRIDDVFLSHADLDHFNGLPGLLDRFMVRQITCTPTFADKHTPGVEQVLGLIQRRGVPMRVLVAGQRVDCGCVSMEILHPPAVGPEGNENARSMVVRLEHEGNSLLLTGDLEGNGLARVLDLPSRPVDVLMAPHHGSLASNVPELARWASPRLVVVCQGPPRGPSRRTDPYISGGIERLGTWPHGAITFHSRRGELTADTFRTRQHLVIKGGK
jgi:competence protein ComEC